MFTIGAQGGGGGGLGNSHYMRYTMGIPLDSGHLKYSGV